MRQLEVINLGRMVTDGRFHSAPFLITVLSSTMADPLSLTTGIISLITLAIKLVVGAVGLIDKTTTAHREAAKALQDLLQDLERLKRKMNQIHDKLQFLAANTKDRALKALLQEYVLSDSSDAVVLIKAQ